MQTIKKYLISSFDTFLAGFLVGAIPLLNSITIQDLSWNTLKATILGIVLVGVRAGLKALREYLIAKTASEA